MHEHQGSHHLEHNEPHLFPFQFALWWSLQQLEQCLVHQFKDQEDLRVVLETVQQLDNVGVALH